jgi:hypothetical protein
VWLALCAVLLAAGGGALAVPLVRAATSGEPAVTQSRQLLACVERSGDTYCQRLADDRAARGPLSNIDRDTAVRFAQRLRAAFEDQLGAQCRAELESCVFAVPPTAETLRAALIEAGFTGPVVRPTRLYDPAPFGTIVYGVRAGAGCLVGWVEGGVGAGPQATGRRSDGTCLSA